MISSKSILITSLATLFIAILPKLSAQVEEPTPTPTEPAKDSLLSKVSFLRVWYVGTPQSPRITLSSDPGEGASRVLGSSMRPGRLGSYRLLKPNPMVAVTYNGSAIPNAEGKLENPGEPLAKSDKIPLKGGAFYTLIVREESGKYSVETLEDLPPEKNLGPKFRVFDFSKLESGGITLSTSGVAEKVWSVDETSPSSRNLPGESGLGRLELIGMLNNKPALVGAYEMDVGPQKSYSIVLYIDRYGHRVFGVAEDAVAAYSEQDIKEFLKEEK